MARDMDLNDGCAAMSAAATVPAGVLLFLMTALKGVCMLGPWVSCPQRRVAYVTAWPVCLVVTGI
jgi:hypothetical protein